MPLQDKDYPRWTCNLCPVKLTCEGLRALRGKIICGSCPTALVCVMKQGGGTPDCEEAQRRWRAGLPGKCLLARSRLTLFVGIDKMGEAFVINDLIQPLCPRCLMPVETKTNHVWKLALGPQQRRQTVVHLRCAFCGLDEGMALK